MVILEHNAMSQLTHVPQMATLARTMPNVLPFNKVDSVVNVKPDGKDPCVKQISMTVPSYLVFSMQTVPIWSMTLGKHPQLNVYTT